MTRSIDTNQIDTINNGFLADFRRAQSNLSIYDNLFNTCRVMAVLQQRVRLPWVLAVPLTTRHLRAASRRRC